MRSLPLLAVLLATPAHAQDVARDDSFPVERLHLALESGAVADVGTARALPAGRIDVGFWLTASDDPLVLLDNQTGERAGRLVHRRLAGALLASVGLGAQLTLGVEMPVVFHQVGDEVILDEISDLSDFGLGDLRLVPRLGLWSGALDVAVALAVTLPTASASDYLGDDGFTAAPTLLATRHFRAFRGGASLAYLARPRAQLLDLVVDDEIGLKLGAGVRLARPLWLDASLSAGTAAREPFARVALDPAELLALLSLEVGEVTGFVGGGFGVNPGFGTPDWRALAGFRYHSGRPAPVPRLVLADGDADHIADDIDRCPDAGETWNQHLDDDGCPDSLPDDDGDGLSGAADRCADVAEDVDGYLDDDGCPETDNDGDGLADGEDACPLEPGADRGCPPPPAPPRVTLSDGRIQLGENVFFPSGSAVLDEVCFPLLDDVARLFLAHPELGQLIVEGHTDDVGRAERNLVLSQARAEAVKAYLVARGVPAGRLDPFGFGETRPLVPGSDEASRAKNRRVVFVRADAP